MAVTKIHPIKVNLKAALDYIENPDKTDDKMLVSSFGCSYETADIEFQMLLDQAFKKGNNLAHHLIQAFEPGETTPEQAHEIGRQLADEVLQGKYPYVLTTHIDKGHLHNHIIFCAVDNLCIGSLHLGVKKAARRLIGGPNPYLMQFCTVPAGEGQRPLPPPAPIPHRSTPYPCRKTHRPW